MKKKVIKKNWLDEEIEFYDFIWKEGVMAHGICINKELLEDFENGGNKFEEMKGFILKKFPTRDDALKVFRPVI